MSKDEPLVSVIMPMHNAEKYISAALDSILADKDLRVEVIVVDDHSTDQSARCVSDFGDERVRLIASSSRGIACAMNEGLNVTRGAIIMCCDSDDMYPASRIREQTAWLDRHPEYDAVCGGFSTTDAAGKIIAKMPCGDVADEITGELVEGKVRTHFCTYAIRSSLVQKVGKFREYFEIGQDIDYQLRLGEAGRVAYVPSNWYYYRLHSTSITHTQSSRMRVFFEGVAFALQKQRRETGQDDLQRGLAPPKPAADRSPVMSARDHIQGHLLGRAWELHSAGNKGDALRTAGRALAVNPFQLHVWRNVVALALKSPRSALP